jgi:hypothetical protein
VLGKQVSIDLITVERYIPERNYYMHDIPNMTTTHVGGGSVTMMNQMIVCSGGNDVVESYDPRAGQKKWTQMRPLPNEGRSHLSMIKLNDCQALVIGGVSTNERNMKQWMDLSLPIYELDIRGGHHEWITHDGSRLGNGGFPSLPFPMTSPSVTYLDNTLIIAHTAKSNVTLERHHRHYDQLPAHLRNSRVGYYLPCHPVTSRPLQLPFTTTPTSTATTADKWLTFELPSTFWSSGLANIVTI